MLSLEETINKFDTEEDFVKACEFLRLCMLNTSISVANGVKLMDSDPNVPSNWRNRVNPLTLRMEDTSSCILGQVFLERLEEMVTQDADGLEYFDSGFDVGIDVMDIECSVRSYGFDVEYFGDSNFEAWLYELAASEWIYWIKVG